VSVLASGARAASTLSLLIAPVWALAQVWGVRRPGRARAVAWLGLGIGFWMVWSVPARALAIGVASADLSVAYPCIAALFGAASLLLGRRIIDAHRARLHGRAVGTSGLGWACLAFAAALAAALAPYAVGAHIPFQLATLEGEVARGGHLGYYLMRAVPVAVAMAAEAFTLLTMGLLARAGACLALFGLVALPPLLHGSL
jgi:hypothetical protein